MHILTHKALQIAKSKYPDAATSLEAWYKAMANGNFRNMVEMKQIFPSADLVGKGFVFNIGGNHYRLAASVHFNTQKVFIREILTHAEASKDTWKKKHKDFA
jgi:mRNA interferase HigB